MLLILNNIYFDDFTYFGDLAILFYWFWWFCIYCRSCISWRMWRFCWCWRFGIFRWFCLFWRFCLIYSTLSTFVYFIDFTNCSLILLMLTILPTFVYIDDFASFHEFAYVYGFVDSSYFDDFTDFDVFANFRDLATFNEVLQGFANFSDSGPKSLWAHFLHQPLASKHSAKAQKKYIFLDILKISIKLKFVRNCGISRKHSCVFVCVFMPRTMIRICLCFLISEHFQTMFWVIWKSRKLSKTHACFSKSRKLS